MSNFIHATYDIDTYDFNINTEHMSKNQIKLFFSIRGKTLPYLIKDLSFGYEISNPYTILDYNEFPPPGVKYEKTDQKFIFSKCIAINEDIDYSVTVWAIKNGLFCKKQVAVKI